MFTLAVTLTACSPEPADDKIAEQAGASEDAAVAEEAPPESPTKDTAAAGDVKEAAPAKGGASATVDVAKLGDWGLVCPEGKMSGKSCRILQQALVNVPVEGGGEGRTQRVMMTMVGYLPEQERPVLSVVAPLGISLPKGVLLDVDGYDQLRMEIQRCSESGCLAFIPMQEQLVEAFRYGEKATITIFPFGSDGRRIRISLDGFDQAVGAIQG